ncbi:MAG TPA: WYL domain-containing protein [Acidimicrobiales bacterium]|nr:WYL domain-containing protein [Acidimicrobiales bacterium]
MDRLERLVNLVAALIDTDRPLTRGEIRERIEGYSDDPEAFRRNFERDKELLRDMGLPLITEPVDQNLGDDVGYRIPRERYELPDPGLDDSELAALRLAASAVQVDSPWADQAVTRALRKLGGAVGEDPAAGDPADPMSGARTASGSVSPAPLRLAALPGEDAATAAFAAIGESRRLRFKYRGESRLVDPWRLSFRRGHWYLAGYDHGREGERLFRLDRVEGGVDSDGPPGAFDRPSGVAAKPPPAWRIGDDEEVIAEVLADPDQVRFVRDSLDGEGSEEGLADGSVVFRFPVRSTASFRSLIFGFLDHVEVLGPPALRRNVVEWLDAITAGAGRA